MARLPKSFYNPISLFGAGLAIAVLGTIIVFAVMDMAGAVQSPYLGIFTYMILPGIMILGLLIIPAGIVLERRRERRAAGAPRKYLLIDLGRPTHRATFMIFLVGTILLVIVSAAGTYRAYTYSESVEFCGEVCHQVMKPEFFAYQHSPHARVRCAECHIGEGADWFVKAKISGMYQVYSVLFSKFSRPISTPIHNLRPARETCERCHWPQKFSNTLDMPKMYFPVDTTVAKPWQITLQLKIGGGMSELGPTAGIHWHMNTENHVEYISTDEKRQVIPWVKTTNIRGETRIFRSTEASVTDSVLAKGEHRTMDCMDCHNRPSHIYYPPFRTVNDLMSLNRIPHDLPGIRAIASAVLTKAYTSTEDADKSIPVNLHEAYASTAPDVAATRAADINKAGKEILEIYRRNFFPEMNANWKAYPNNIGHMYNDGCFRCHDNKHVDQKGHVLTNDCKVCHLILSQGPAGNTKSDMNGMEFIHPADVGGADKEERCSTCHTGE